MRADPELQARMEYLARRCTEGTEGELSPEEKAEYDTFVSANNLIAILQAKARGHSYTSCKRWRGTRQ